MFHRLPTNTERRCRWLNRIGRIDLLGEVGQKTALIVCGAHFLPHHYQHVESVYLHRNALPFQERASLPFRTTLALVQNVETQKPISLYQPTYEDPQPSTSKAEENYAEPATTQAPPPITLASRWTKRCRLHDEIKAYLEEKECIKSKQFTPRERGLATKLTRAARLLAILQWRNKKKRKKKFISQLWTERWLKCHLY